MINAHGNTALQEKHESKAEVTRNEIASEQPDLTYEEAEKQVDALLEEKKTDAREIKNANPK